MRRTGFSAVRLLALGLSLWGSVAWAAAGRGAEGPGCCSLLFFALFVWIYRSGGTDWGRSIGATLVPGVFGWFIWRDRELGATARWVAVISATLQVVSILTGLIALVFLKSLTAAYAPKGLPGVDSEPTSLSRPVDLTNVPEDLSLGLHPPANITTDPPGATVYVDGEKRGVTPLKTPLSAGKRNDIKVELEGYFPATQQREPNAKEELHLTYTLQAAALLEVTTEPSGARVLVDRKEVLGRTPGVTEPLEIEETEVLVLRDGHLPQRHLLKLAAGKAPLALTLVPGVKVSVTSQPDQADVFVDGHWLGLTPTDVFVSPKGKHTVEVKKESWANAKKVFTHVSAPTRLDVTLVDTDRLAAKAAATRARAQYDRVNQALEKVQEKMDSMMNPPNKLARQRVALERDMERATTALEEAEARLKVIEQARAAGQVPPSPGEEVDAEP